MNFDFTISPSQMNVLETCELRWAFDHVEVHGGKFRDTYRAHEVVLVSAKGGTIVKPVFAFNAFGTVSHNMFDRFYKVDFKSPESFASAWRGAWGYFRSVNPIVFNPRSEMTLSKYIERGMQMAARYYEEHIGRRDKKPEFEKKFEIPVQTENFRVLFTGRTDQIDHEEEGDVISDFKTGRRTAEEELRSGPQFVGYSFQHARRHGNTPAVNVIFPGYGDVATSVASLKFSEDDHQKFVQRMDESGKKRFRIIENVGKGEKLVARYGPHCMYCPYSLSGECDMYTGERKFSHRELAITVPTQARVLHKPVPLGQRRFGWKKNVIIISNESSEPPRPAEPRTLDLFPE